MPKQAAEQVFAERLEAIRQRVGDPVRLDHLAEAVREIQRVVPASEAPGDARLYAELESLARFIHDARSEIAQVRPEEISSHFIPTATDELDAIIQATEEATNQILDAAEVIEGVSESLPEAAERLAGATTRIYEACNFQDITGQRITKVVSTLKAIEDKVDHLVRAFEPAATAGVAAGADGKAAATPTDDDLLNGPQLPDSAASQADVDALLAKFDD